MPNLFQEGVVVSTVLSPVKSGQVGTSQHIILFLFFVQKKKKKKKMN